MSLEMDVIFVELKQEMVQVEAIKTYFNTRLIWQNQLKLQNGKTGLYAHRK